MCMIVLQRRKIRRATNKFVSFRNFSTLAVLIDLFLLGLWDLNISEDGT